MALRLKIDDGIEERVRTLATQVEQEAGAQFANLGPMQKTVIRQWLRRAAFLGVQDERKKWAFRAYQYAKIVTRIADLEAMRDGLLAQMAGAGETMVEDDGT